MSALSVAQAVAANVGIAKPSALVSSTDPNAVKLLQMVNEAGQEVARRADWGRLEKTFQITGAGSNDAFDLPDDFSRLTTGNAVLASGMPVRGSLSRDEWFSLGEREGQPRYFRLAGSRISFWPYPKSGEVVLVSYLSTEWCEGGEAFEADDNVSYVPEVLLEMGAVARWKRSIGADFSDYQAEYEATLEQLAMFDQRERLP